MKNRGLLAIGLSIQALKSNKNKTKDTTSRILSTGFVKGGYKPLLMEKNEIDFDEKNHIMFSFDIHALWGLHKKIFQLKHFQVHQCVFFSIPRRINIIDKTGFFDEIEYLIFSKKRIWKNCEKISAVFIRSSQKIICFPLFFQTKIKFYLSQFWKKIGKFNKSKSICRKILKTMRKTLFFCA